MQPSISSPRVFASSPALIEGEGEMATLIRAKDWSTTPLGALETWSETLVASVNHMLLAPFSFALYWGGSSTLIYNDTYRAFLAEKHPNALGRTGPEVWQEAWPTIGPPIQQAFAHGTITRAAEVFIPIRVAGVLTDRWWTYSFYPVYRQGCILGVANPGSDDTPRVLEQRARETAEQARRITAERLNQVLAATSDAIITVSRDWTITYINPAAEQLYRPSGAFVGRNVWQAFPESAHPGSPFYDHAVRAMHEEIPGRFESYYPDPLNITLAVEVYPTRDGLVSFSRDVTEHKRTAAALMQNEKLAAVGRLASSIAHEINNPLESVTNLLYLMQHSTSLDEMKDYVQTAERELRRVSIITNQTLRFHRQSTSRNEAFCFDLIGDSLSIFQGRLLNSNIGVEKLKRAEHPVSCLAGEIRQVLANLIANAIDAMPGGGRLLLRSRETTHWPTGRRGIVLTVADTGSGIPEATRKKIFEAFFTTKGIGGTGLGLWISCEIVARHQGTLRLRSATRPGASGTVFCLFLPFDAIET